MAACQPLSPFYTASLPSSSACYVRSGSYSSGIDFGKVGNELLKNSHLVIFSSFSLE